MSFRKRSEVLSRREPGVRAVPGRVPTGAPTNARYTGQQALQSTTPQRRGAPQDTRGTGGTGRLPQRLPLHHMADLNISDAPRSQELNNETIGTSHPGIRPSPATSQQTTSTGSIHLDRVLGHAGLPLGNSIIVEEQGTTEFSSVLCRLFAAQGIIHNRLDNASSRSDNTHLCVISSNDGLSKELPGLYKGSSKDIKKTKIAEEQSKITVQNLTGQANPTRYNDLKIAWRYKLGDENEDQKSKNPGDLASEAEQRNYSNQFDITSRIMPAPTPAEMSFVSPNQPVQRILSQVEQTVKKHDGKLIRLILPSLLHPAMYSPSYFRLSGIIPLLHGLKSLLKKYENRCVLIATLSSDLLDEFLLSQIENEFDAVLNLEPFNQEMLQFLEKAYKSQPNKVQHGLLHISKLPVFSDRGEMHVMRSHYAFKNGRKKFEIEEWGIPVGDVDDSNKDDVGSSVHAKGHSTTSKVPHEPDQSTNISIDF